MATWKSRGLRGSALEEMLNQSIDIYRQNKLALIQKIPTPITPIDIDKDSRHITLAYFDKKSTVDYIGVVQGVPICFDAKECASDAFPLSNIHGHQMEFMGEFEAQQGIAFIILAFTKKDEVYYLPYKKLLYFWNRMIEGGRKSIAYDEFDKDYKVSRHRDVLLHFIKPLSMDLGAR